MSFSALRFSIGHPHQFRWLRGILLAVLALNVADALLTMHWLAESIATESNPLMESLVLLGPVPFLIGKLTLVSLGCYLLWRHCHRALAVVGVFATFVVYYFVLLHHLRFVGFVLAEHWVPTIS
ncbi:MAG: DUF5658 family protein [Proteobacteria bacterium]|nr:DUF5658 family protein [Pseudomonadota bacterium]